MSDNIDVDSIGDFVFSPAPATNSPEPDATDAFGLPADYHGFVEVSEDSHGVELPEDNQATDNAPPNGRSPTMVAEASAVEPNIEHQVEAKTKTDMMETLTWFKQHQKGVYNLNGVIHGMYLTQSFGQGECITPDGSVLITRISRKTANDSAITEFATRTGFAKKNMADDQPIGFILAHNWPELSVALPEDIWGKTAGFWILESIWGMNAKDHKGKDAIYLMGKFVSMLPEEDRWFRAQLSTDAASTSNPNPEPIPEDAEPGPKTEICSHCQKESTRIIWSSWFCTNLDCAKVGENHGGAKPTTLDYLPSFLKPNLTQKQRNAPCPALTPTVEDLPLGKTRASMKGSMKKLQRGWKCTNCNLVNARTDPNMYTCSCGNSIPSQPPTFPNDWFLNKKEDFPTQAMYRKSARLSKIKVPHIKKVTKAGTQLTFELAKLSDGEELKIVASYQNRATQRKPGGAVGLFNESQTLMRSGELEHQRRQVGTAKGKPKAESKKEATKKRNMKGGLSQSFNTSVGRWYKQAMNSNSGKSYEQAPPFISKMRDIMTNEVKGHTTEDPKFNETMALEFWADNGMNYHNDGERGLGPITTSYVLGGNSSVAFCMHPDYDAGFDKNGEPVMDPPWLPWCQKEAERRSLAERHERGEISQDEFVRLFKELVKGNKRLPKKSSKTILQLPTPSGTCYSMIGRKLQKFYWHKVINHDIFRMSYICRHIGDDHLGQENEAEKAKDDEEEGDESEEEESDDESEDEGEEVEEQGEDEDEEEEQVVVVGRKRGGGSRAGEGTRSKKPRMQ